MMVYPEPQRPEPERQLWDRHGEESFIAYGAFRVYLEMGGDRSLIKAYRLAKEKPEAPQIDGTWSQWSRRWRWQERATAWDQHQRDLQAMMEEGTLRELARETVMTRMNHRDDLIASAKKCLGKANEMLDWPLQRITQKQTEDGTTTVTIIEPAKWAVSDIPSLLKIGHQMMDLALRMEHADQYIDAEKVIDHLALTEGLTDDEKEDARRQLRAIQGGKAS